MSAVVVAAFAAACPGALAASVASLQLKQGLIPCKACQAFSSLLLDGSRGHQPGQGVYRLLCYGPTLAYTTPAQASLHSDCLGLGGWGHTRRPLRDLAIEEKPALTALKFHNWVFLNRSWSAPEFPGIL